MYSWITLGNIADILGVLGSIAAFFAWMQSWQVSKKLESEKLRKEKKIRVILGYGAEKLELPMEMQRGEFSRAELLGRLGMLPTEGGKRFSLGFLNTAEFLKRLNEITLGETFDVLLIPCTEEEFGQFKV